ncbi:hypothetical protein GUJ93_ZPchr1151g22264 [Zizania palustris]|uniref:Uncharacterized protein n=1 Tax=Zizania palustris TaxID=103762 RepID=A0A8J5RK89_ZIZPA|nr:hypothetical protein GUJ93_ZPchr1151g22264 [Zizania palustris]
MKLYQNGSYVIVTTLNCRAAARCGSRAAEATPPTTTGEPWRPTALLRRRPRACRCRRRISLISSGVARSRSRRRASAHGSGSDDSEKLLSLLSSLIHLMRP